MESLRLLFLSFSSTLLIVLVFAASDPSEITCKDSSCGGSVCAPTNCSYGKLMYSPDTPCSCCKTCYKYIAENENCGTHLSNSECGPGLYCTKITEFVYKCLKMDTPCFKAQKDYEDRKQNGLLGSYETRPSCDANGDFGAKKCQPGASCYCVDKNGDRIFGESPPVDDLTLTDPIMNCACSRAYQLFVGKGVYGKTVPFLHCLPNGNYDPLQCINDACFCIAPITQVPVTQMVPITAITSLPCYKPDIHYETYYRPCEQERVRAQKLIYSYARQNITVLTIEVPDCSPDGNYLPVRSTATTRYCADPLGTKIEDFEVYKDSPSAEEMDCSCARTRYWLKDQTLAKPSCCRNGNFRKYQCRGGVCFCVDSSGNQDGLEVPAQSVSTLACYNEDDC